uniref:Spermatogenesis-associated protein 31E1-like n=1 Tax=Callorhinus ursinus TaxID=34884 RepID=A0A3Q7QY17_CALUR|nr:spermatogenesis-associated protein 31E1-like [Callorhinus ursinus]
MCSVGTDFIMYQMKHKEEENKGGIHLRDRHWRYEACFVSASTRPVLSCLRAAVQSGTNEFQRKEMENCLFPQKCITGGWLSSSPTSWALNIILAFLCGLGLFFLLLSYFQTNPSLPPRKKHRNIRKYQAKPWRRNNRSKKKNQTLKACRDCLQELEEVQDLFSLLQSHLARVSDQGHFQLLHRAAPGQVRRGVPAGAHQPCREPMEDAPTVAPSPSPAPLTGHPLPRTSSVSVHSHSSLSTSWPSEPFLPPDGFSHQPLALPPSPPWLPPSEACPPPLTASLALEQPDSPLTLPQCDSMAPPLHPIPQSSSPHTPWLASSVPAISGLGRSSCPISALSWWQAAPKTWTLSTSTRLESHQEPLAHRLPEALFWGDPTHRQGETGIPPFINLDIQKLLEILIAKRTDLKTQKEKEEKEESDCHLTSFGRMFKSPGDKQDTMGDQHFWSLRGKPKQPLSPEKPPHPKTSGDNLQQKCNQFFWGLPFLHSESLVATVGVADSPLEFPSVQFNELSHALPLQIQDNIAPHLSLTQSLSDTLAQPQPFTLDLSQSQPLPLAQPQHLPLDQPQHLLLHQSQPQPLPQAQPQHLPLDQPQHLLLDQSQPQPLPRAQPQRLPLDQPQPQAHFAPSVPIGPSSLPPEMGTYEVSCPESQKTPSFTSNAIQNLECHFLKKQLERGRTLPAVVKRSQEVFSQGSPDLPQDGQDPQGHGSVSVLPRDLINPELRKQLEWHLWKKFMKHQSGLSRRIQLSVKLLQPHREFQKVPQAISRHRPVSESDSTDGSCQATPRTGSRYPAKTMPRKSLDKDSSSTAERIQKDLHRGSASSPGKAPGINSEESDTDLKPSTSSADKKHPEKVLRAHLGRKLGQIREGQIPADVHRSRLTAHHALDLLRKPSTHRKTGKPAFSKGWEPYRTTSHNFSILSPYTQRMLEAHIIRFRVKHRWSLPLKVLKPINLFKLKKSFSFPRSSTTRLATCVSKACSKTKFLGKPPRPHQGEEVVKESYPTLGSPLPAPQPTCEEIQQALQGTSPRDGRGPLEAPLAGQEARSPSQTLAYSFVGRIWHREPASGTLMNSSLESSPSPATATSEPRESGGRASQDSCYSIKVLALDLESQYLSAKESREPGEVEEAPAWGVTLEPSVWANNRTIRADLRRSGSSEKSDSPSPPTELFAQDPEELFFDAQFREFELRKLMKSENQPQDNAASVLLQDCETGVLLQDCATDSLLQDCQSDVFLAADILASQGSLSGFQSGSREAPGPTSQVLYGLRSSGQKIQRQSEPLGLRDQYKSRSKSSVPTAEREYYRRPSRREPEKELSGLKIRHIREMSHTAQHKDAVESSGSKACQLLLKKETVPPESYFRRRMRHFIQCFFPSKGKRVEESLQKGKSSSSRRRRPVIGRSTVDSATTKAQVLMTAVGQILQEKMVPHHGVRAPEFSWCQRDLQASAGPNVCYHRVLSYQEQRRVMRKTASNQQGTPKGHSYANKTEWIRSRDNRQEAERHGVPLPGVTTEDSRGPTATSRPSGEKLGGPAPGPTASSGGPHTSLLWAGALLREEPRPDGSRHGPAAGPQDPTRAGAPGGGAQRAQACSAAASLWRPVLPRGAQGGPSAEPAHRTQGRREQGRGRAGPSGARGGRPKAGSLSLAAARSSQGQQQGGREVGNQTCTPRSCRERSHGQGAGGTARNRKEQGPRPLSCQTVQRPRQTRAETPDRPTQRPPTETPDRPARRPPTDPHGDL